MSKYFATSEDIKELAFKKFAETGLEPIGLNLKVISVPKAKGVLKISMASAATEYLLKEDMVVTLFIYEAAFDRLGDEFKEKLMEGVFSNLSYDSEKDKLNVDNSRYGEYVRMRRKYSNYGDIIETAVMTVEQIDEEEKQRKEEEKALRAEKKANRER